MATGTAVGWRLALWGVVGLLLAAGFIGTACPPPPLPRSPRDSALAELRAEFAADTARAWAWGRSEQRRADSALRVSRTAKAEAERLRARRVVQTPPVFYTNADSVPMVPKADYDSLAAEADSLWSAVRADSVAYAAQADRIRADSAAYATLTTLRAEENRIHSTANSTLRGALAKARRGCRVLGLLPCPEISAGYGATLTGGQVRTGPVLAVTIPVGW